MTQSQQGNLLHRCIVNLKYDTHAKGFSESRALGAVKAGPTLAFIALSNWYCRQMVTYWLQVTAALEFLKRKLGWCGSENTQAEM